MTHEEADKIDDMIEKAIYKVCQATGGENADHPLPRSVRGMFKESGLAIVPLRAESAEDVERRASFARELTGMMSQNPDHYLSWLPFVERVWAAALKPTSD